MLKAIKYTFRGGNGDVTKSKHPLEFYYDAQHIKLLATDAQSTGSITNEKGNERVITLPSFSVSNNQIIYGDKKLLFSNTSDLQDQLDSSTMPTSTNSQIIIGHSITRDSIIFFSTDDEGTDAIWELEGVLNKNYDLKLLYIRNMNFSSDHLIQGLFNYENENIQKIYWVDGVNQIRFMNIKQDDLIDVPLNTLNFVGNVKLSQPRVETISSGGDHTAGMVQYAHNLYRLNSSQTKLSPLSEIIPLTNGGTLGGGDVNEKVSTTPVVTIDNLDLQYTHIIVYAIRYTSLDQTPSVEIIEEREIGGQSSISIYDDGSNIGTISLEALLFLGSDPIVPQHIASKDNVLFPVNIKEQNFDIPEELDVRAYSFNLAKKCLLYDNVVPNTTNPYIILDQYTDYNVDSTYDAINLDYDNYKYQSNGYTIGGEGKYIKYRINQKYLSDEENYRLFKDREVYRIGIQFYNKLGQVSLPKWIADFRAPSGNLQGVYNTLEVSFKTSFITFINNYSFESDNDKPVGYKIIRAKRNQSDRTILSQGPLTPMMFQVKGEQAQAYTQFKNKTAREPFQDTNLKIPSYLTRNFEKLPVTDNDDNNGVLSRTTHLFWLNDDGPLLGEGGEIYNATRADQKVAQSFTHSKMMQLHSPEVMFDMVTSFPADTDLYPIGVMDNVENGVYAKEVFVETKLTNNEGNTLGGLNPWRIDESQYTNDDKFKLVFDTPEGGNINNNHRFIGPAGAGGSGAMNFYQYYRQYKGLYANSGSTYYPIYGTPEINDRGASSRFYNNDPRYNYANSLQSFLGDGEDDCDACDPIASINSYGSKNVMIVLGDSGDSTNDRNSIENIYGGTGITHTKGVLISEIRRSEDFLYFGNIYGGNSYEEKKRTSYIEIGEYTDIDTLSVQIDNPGDTYVQPFKFLRIGKTDTEIYDKTQLQISEIVEVTLETSIDLKNRYDISNSSWDSRFQPRESEFHGYNTVYSQQPTLIQNSDVDFTFQKVDNFDTRVQATKTKIPNEIIDSWTDILINEVQDLDGKYGPINSVVNFKDEIFTFQDEGVAKLFINPRVQVQGSDGLAIELGKGSLLYDYKYLTTKSGCINKWGTVSSRDGIYYYDALNKGLYKYPSNLALPLSDQKGYHVYFNDNFDYDMLKVDNPVKASGVSMGYDSFNHDIYLSLLQGDKSFTRVFNEAKQEFVDLKTYKPAWYIPKGDTLYITDPTNKMLYEQYKGEYNVFFEESHPSYVILQVNPSVDMDSIFHNIFYRSEIYLDDIDQPDKTLTHIDAYNEYQKTGRILLTVGRNGNIRRKFRQWRADIPREAGTRNKLRNPWIYLKLELANDENYQMILHDISVLYTNY